MLAYHFTGKTLWDGSPIPPIGHKLIMEGKIIPCQRGYHASLHPFDALTYAPGEFLHLVKLSGTIKEESDKVVASERTILKSFDATELLRDFACDQALSVIHLWNAPQVVKDYLTTKNPALRAAAWDAARAAAWDAAGDAAVAAARAAAWDAAGDAAVAAAVAAAWDAAGDAARDAARAAAWDAAWAAARKIQRDSFKLAVDKKFETL